jgi:hypothetical protein
MRALKFYQTGSLISLWESHRFHLRLLLTNQNHSGSPLIIVQVCNHSSKLRDASSLPPGTVQICGADRINAHRSWIIFIYADEREP